MLFFFRKARSLSGPPQKIPLPFHHPIAHPARVCNIAHRIGKMLHNLAHCENPYQNLKEPNQRRQKLKPPRNKYEPNRPQTNVENPRNEN